MGAPKKYSDEEIIEMGEKFIKLAHSDEMFHVTEFSEVYGKCPHWVYETARRYPVFNDYLTRARNILGTKLLRLSIKENPSMYIQKTFIKRYLSNDYENMEDWVREDIQMEAQAKAEAIKNANLNEVNPIVYELIERLDKIKLNEKSPKSKAD